jgi:Reverse transcriptase (RNA-dependent DNA polymerase)
MQNAETVLNVLRERGRRGLPCDELYRQLFNRELYLLAYGRLYSNDGALTPGADGETVDGMSLARIGRVISALRAERYRFRPARRVYIPKANGKKRPLGVPSWSDKLVGEVVRLLLEAYYEPRFSDRSHGFRPGRGCHTALSEVRRTWTGTTWFIEGDISDCLDPWSHCSFADLRVQKSPSWWAGTSIRRPFLRPVRVRTARSSPRLTFCNTVCRETPSARLAWCRASQPSGASLVTMPRS